MHLKGLITSKGTDIDENIANQNHATRTRTPKPGYLKLTIETDAAMKPSANRAFETFDFIAVKFVDGHCRLV